MWHLVLAALLLALPSTLWAQAVVLLPPRGDAQLAQAQAQAHRVLANALSSQGLRVVPHAEAQARMPEGPPCMTSDCAPGLVAAASADFAAVLAVWAGADGGPGVVFVTLVDPEGARFPGQSKVGAGDLQAATSAALLDARGLQLLGPGPWLRVSGEPDGARVFIDGSYVGAVPYRATVKPGKHAVKVTAEGYTPLEREIDVPANRSRQVEIGLSLEVLAGDTSQPLAGGAADPAAVGYDDGGAGAEGDAAVLGPVLLGAAGLGLSLYATIDMAGAGSCADEDSQGVCLREHRSQGAGGIYLGVGIGAMAGALLWFILSGDDEQSAALRLQVGPGALGASGNF